MPAHSEKGPIPLGDHTGASQDSLEYTALQDWPRPTGQSSREGQGQVYWGRGLSEYSFVEDE